MHSRHCIGWENCCTTAPVVKLVDTQVLGTCSQEWGFESLPGHHNIDTESEMTKQVRPIGWANTILSTKEAWDSIMTINGSSLRKLDPRVAHMVFQILAFMWSGIFAVMIGSYMAFGISAAFHLVFITGVFITAITLNAADKNPQKVNTLFNLRPGYHSVSRTRQTMWINGQKVKLDANDPGGEHE